MDAINVKNEYYPSPEDGDRSTSNVMGRGGGGSGDGIVNPVHRQAGGDKQMNAIFKMCKHNQWDNVLNSLKSNPGYITKSMAMTNNIETSVLHQAITSKGSLQARVKVIDFILDVAPEAAAKRNGYQSLPLHVICQRNTRLSAKSKERLITTLIQKFPQGLNETGGVGKRTPIHIVFTDYVSLELTTLMIDTARNVAESMNVQNACFIKDKHGNLPHHVACSRHVSPGKLEKLLEVNPEALMETNNQKATLLRLATSTATKSHPNNALIKYLEGRMKDAGYEPQPLRSKRGSPAPGIKPSPLGNPQLGGRTKMEMSGTPMAPVHRGRSDPSPGPGMYNLTAAVSFAAAASPGYAAHVGQVPQIKIKQNDQNRSKRNTRRNTNRHWPVAPPFAVQQLNVQQHQSPFKFMAEPEMYEHVHHQPSNQNPGDANLLLQFARGGSSDDNEIKSVEV